MLVFKSDMDYCVYLEEDGDDLWVSVTNGYCESFDCIVGSKEEALDVKACVETAYHCFYPAQYVSEKLEPNDDRHRLLYLAKDAYEIDRALEYAMST